LSGTRQKYVLIIPSSEADVLFFKGLSEPNQYGFQQGITTALLSDAHIFEYDMETMQYMLDKAPALQKYSAVPIEGVDIFKAKLAGV